MTIEEHSESDSLQAYLQALQATAALSSFVISLFLVCCQTSYVAVIQIYPSASLLNYNLYFSSHILCIKRQVCGVTEVWNVSLLQCGETHALINDPVRMVIREGLELPNDSSLWGPFMTEDMMPGDALHQQQNLVKASLCSQEHNVQRGTALRLKGDFWYFKATACVDIFECLNEWHKPNIFGTGPVHNLSRNTVFMGMNRHQSYAFWKCFFLPLTYSLKKEDFTVWTDAHNATKEKKISSVDTVFPWGLQCSLCRGVMATGWGDLLDQFQNCWQVWIKYTSKYVNKRSRF